MSRSCWKTTIRFMPPPRSTRAAVHTAANCAPVSHCNRRMCLAAIRLAPLPVPPRQTARMACMLTCFRSAIALCCTHLATALTWSTVRLNANAAINAPAGKVVLTAGDTVTIPMADTTLPGANSELTGSNGSILQLGTSSVRRQVSTGTGGELLVSAPESEALRSMIPSMRAMPC